MEKDSVFESGFAKSDSDEWKKILEKDLKGITFDDLSSVDRNGINIYPFYMENVQTSESYKNPDWYIMDHINDTNDNNGNIRALSVLNQGVTGLIWEVSDHSQLDVLLKDIDLRYIHLHLRYSGDSLDHFKESLHAHIKQYYSKFDVSIQISQAKSPFTIYDSYLHINAGIYNNAGSNAVTELSAILSQLNEALHQADNSQLARIKIVYIQLAIDTQFYEQIAKLRAIRILAAKIMLAYGIKAQLFLAVESSLIYIAPWDIYSNILRNAIAGMAASIGGADSLYLHNFSYAKDASFTSRISRNQQLLFKEEAHLDLVIDKGKGSYFIENYTAELVNRAWIQFQDFEAKGGWFSIIETQVLNTFIESQALELIQAYKEGKKLLIGVNKYQVKDELPLPIPNFEGEFGLNPVNIATSIRD